MTSLPDALAPLAQYPQFICYKLVPKDDRPGKFDKLPCDHRSGAVAAAQDSAIWTDHATAQAAASRFGAGYGVGFVLTPQAGFFCLDIDNCLQPDNTWSALANELCGRLAGAAVEVSVSGRGLHVFGRGTIPPHAKKNTAHGLELYSGNRFIALGRDALGNAAADCTDALAGIIAQYFPFNAADESEDIWTDTPVAEWSEHEDDDQLIARACASSPRVDAAAVFGESEAAKVTFADLWNRNAEALAKRYVRVDPRDPHAYDESSADMALAQHLAYWTGKNMERMRRLMRASKLNRDKYEKRRRTGTYLEETIRRACARCEKVAQRSATAAPTVVAGAVGRECAPRGSYVQPDQQPAFFHGCVYVSDLHQILVPGGVMKSEAQFKVMYGGRVLVLDAANEKIAKNAYEAFVDSRVNEPPTADSTCFRPDLPPGAIVEESGRTYANIWWPVKVPRMRGDVSPFLEHVAKLLPDERDQRIILSYMAACVQYQGTKFRWAPLIQGAPGNGKTTLTNCVFEAIGDTYAYMPTASHIANKFNHWVMNRVFFGVEDIYVPDAQREILEIIKPMITGERIEIEAKGRDQITARVYGNFMFNSNHKDAIRKTRDDRRFAVFYTAQQSVDDIMRDGMTPEYFLRLQNWLRKENGYAYVTDYLYTYAIHDEFNPATHCVRAPETSSTEAAIIESRGVAEQEITEAVAEGRQGFAGGWISSKHLIDLLKNERKHFGRNKLPELLRPLGYVKHPGLVDGKPNNPIPCDGGRSTLFVKDGHPAMHIVGAAAIAKAYSDAQMSAINFGVTTEGV